MADETKLVNVKALRKTAEKAKADAQKQISAQLSSVYKPAGSVAFEDLPTPSAEILGNVYTVTNEFTTDEKFKTPSQGYPAGTDVVVVVSGDAGTEYKYDVRVSSANVNVATDEEIDAMLDEVFPED